MAPKHSTHRTRIQRAREEIAGSFKELSIGIAAIWVGEKFGGSHGILIILLEHIFK